jgi:uncharacterized membrane protein YccC|tara:strand:- start:23282 stop:23653 length:372 start_codon:yes stop_codon:yes gene_type:complete
MKKIDIDYLKAVGAKAKGKRPYFFNDPTVEKVLSITMSVAGELAVMRERLDTIERLLEKNGSVSRDEIESYEPDDSAADERQRWHAEYIARILRIIQQEREAIENGQVDPDVEELAKEKEFSA